MLLMIKQTYILYEMNDDIMWPDVKKLIENYKKFLTYPHDSCKMVVTNLTTME